MADKVSNSIEGSTFFKHGFFRRLPGPYGGQGTGRACRRRVAQGAAESSGCGICAYPERLANADGKCRRGQEALSHEKHEGQGSLTSRLNAFCRSNMCCLLIIKML